jgi:hypothetical protein
MPPQLGEAMIREAWRSVSSYLGPLPRLGAKLMKTVVLAPLGWLVLAPVFGRKLSPFICQRYTLTNRRIMIQHGLKPKPVLEVPLTSIDDVRLVPGSLDEFYRSGDLEVIANGQVALRLVGVPEPESFRYAILNAVKAWAPGKVKEPWLPANAPVK